jgi:hypothetical protein
LTQYRQPTSKRESGELTSEQRVVQRGSHLLKVAVEFDALEAQGRTGTDAVNELKMHSGYDSEVVTALEALRGGSAREPVARDIPLGALKRGMVFAADVRLTNGTLFAARGYEVSDGLLERLKNFRAGSVKEPIKVYIRGD